MYSGTVFQKLQEWKYHKMRSLKKAMNQMKPWKRGHGSYLFDPSCVNDFYLANSNAPVTPSGPCEVSNLESVQVSNLGIMFFVVVGKLPHKKQRILEPFFRTLPVCALHVLTHNSIGTMNTNHNSHEVYNRHASFQILGIIVK